MPELPDIEDYLAALRPRVLGQPLEGARIVSFSLLRTFDPPIEALVGREVVGLRRLGKRIVFEFAAGDRPHGLFLVLHLMIAGRLRWQDAPGAAVPRRYGLAALDFSTGTLIVTEAGTKKRASLHVVAGEAALAEHDRGGLEPLRATHDEFVTAVTRENRTLKRALTDQRLIAGIGNAFSDEILHAARLSPVRRTAQLDADALTRLYDATVSVLSDWTARLRAATGDGFPRDVTAFRPDFAVHGRYGQPCPVCGTPVQRIRYADNETNYCPACQTDGRVLADRSLSRLLKQDWPATVTELDA
jgi:formamidopyrimidine-DNA glycosylase